MTRAEFIEALKIQTSDAAVFGTTANLERPPGRKPREQDVILAKWYATLAESDKEQVRKALREAAELAVFSFLCVLDGVSAIENGPEKGDLRLTYIKTGAEMLLNDPSQEFLHDLYNTLCQITKPLNAERPTEPGAPPYATRRVGESRRAKRLPRLFAINCAEFSCELQEKP